MTVGQLNVALGLVVSKSEWKQGEAYINHFRRIALTFGAVFGGRVLGKALIGFNSEIEKSKNQIAGMLAFARGTTIDKQLVDANWLYSDLRTKAAALPGQTQDYVNMLGKIADPLARANFSLEQMSDFTANAYVISEAIGEGWQKSSRDIREFIKYGKMTQMDQFLLTTLGSAGYKTDAESRKGYKNLTAEQRGKMLDKAIRTDTSKSIGKRFGESFEGRKEQVVDAIKQAMGKMGEGLFEALKTSMTNLAEWLQNNKATIQGWATSVGNALAGAFRALQDGISWLLDHRDVFDAFLFALGGQLLFVTVRALGAWMAIAWPLFAGAGVFYVFKKLTDLLGPIPTMMIAIGVAAGMMWLGVFGPIGIVIGLITAFVGVLHSMGIGIKDIFEAIVTALREIADYFSMGVMDMELGSSGMTVGDFAAQKEAEQSGVPVRQMSAQEIAAGAAASTNIKVGDTSINITTADATGVKKALTGFENPMLDQALRAANRNMGGK